MHTLSTSPIRSFFRTTTRKRACVVAAALATALAAAPNAQAATDVEADASVEFQGRLTGIIANGEGFCDYVADVRLRGRTDAGRPVRAAQLRMSAQARCDAETSVGDAVSGHGDVTVVGRAGGPKSRILVVSATGPVTFGTATTTVSGVAAFGPEMTTFLLEGNLRGRIDASTPKGDGLCEYSLTAQIDGFTSDGYRLRPTRYEEVIWTLMCEPELTVRSRVSGSVDLRATGWIDVISIDIVDFTGDLELSAAGGAQRHLGFGSWSSSTAN